MSNSHLRRKSPIKLISECYVKPKHEIEDAKQAYYLGPFELALLSIDPIQKGFLFKLDHHTQDIDSTDRTTDVYRLLNKLKDSLSIALDYFYPLAGRFTTHIHVEDNASSIFIDCNKGPGARFIHAMALDLTVSDIHSPIDVAVVRPFFDLGEEMVNYDGHTKALLSIQLTELLDGVFIGFSMSHSVVDGTSFIHFVNMLSEIFRSSNSTSGSNVTQISRMPVFNYRPWLSYSANIEKDVPVLKFPSLNVEELINREYDPGPLRERIFHFSQDAIAKLKAKVNQQCGTDNVISSFQALTAFVWRSITQARNLRSDEQTSCFIAVGARSRFDPPITDDYIGNYVSMILWPCRVEELLYNDLGWVAMKLYELLKAQDGKAILDFYKAAIRSLWLIPRGTGVHFLGTNSVSLGGSARFDMYRPEFGLGRALAIRMGYGNKDDGKITANPGSEGGGSVELEICLRPHSMGKLEANQEFMSFVSVE